MARPLVVFFGSGPVAATSLELLSRHMDIEAVITKPRPAHHRGSVPVLDVARKHSFVVYEVENKQQLSDLFKNHRVRSRVGIVIDFGIIINQDVIDRFPLGIVNSHFSLLPEWRGADPITFSILSGQPQTGISLMVINAKMDEGPLFAQATYDIPEGTTAPQLTDELIRLSDRTLKNFLPLYIEGKIIARPQEEVTVAASKDATYSRKLTKDDSLMDFSKPAEQLEREIRAFIEWPRSRTFIGGKDVVITAAHVIDGQGQPGDLWKQGKQFGFYTAHGILVVDRLKPAGKPEMTAEAFLAGYQALLDS